MNPKLKKALLWTGLCVGLDLAIGVFCVKFYWPAVVELYQRLQNA